jgi:hypothetical protein
LSSGFNPTSAGPGIAVPGIMFASGFYDGGHVGGPSELCHKRLNICFINAVGQPHVMLHTFYVMFAKFNVVGICAYGNCIHKWITKLYKQ